VIHWLGKNAPFPPTATALREPNGLLAAGGDLSAQRLLDAYRQGIFPWFSEGDPVLWWSPDPRMVMFPAELKVSRSLRKTLRCHRYEIRTDSHFRAVMEACAAPREGHDGTWICGAMVAAYTELYERGYAHSVETWIDGELAGGLYGVALGRMFYGESMFSRKTDSSKIAFVHLVRQLERWSFAMIDCQMKTSHLASLGAREIPRAEFAQRLAQLIDLPGKPTPWHFDHDLVE
jgi:leucyl/phenylalanyl-tRNA--protein transferase